MIRDGEGWIGAVGAGSWVDLRVRAALKEGSFLPGDDQYGTALLADRGIGIQSCGGSYKVTANVVGPDNYDAQAELAELTKLVAAKPAGILISVADAAVLQPEIDAAVAAGIPVITIDSDAAASRRLYFIGTNNLEAGRLGGKRLVEKTEAARAERAGFHHRRPAQYRGAAEGLEGRPGHQAGHQDCRCHRHQGRSKNGV